LIPRRRGEWVELVPDAGESIRLPLHALPAGLEAGREIDESAWAELARESEYHTTYERALRILALREHFRRELETKLYTKCRNRTTLRRVLDALIERDFLNDARAAEAVAEYITRGGAVGPRLLKAELLRRGCPPELVAELVERFASEQAEVDGLGKLLEGKRNSLARKAEQLREKLGKKGASGGRLDSQVRAQLGAGIMAWLAGRGFMGEEVRERVKAMVEEIV
jgi:regulatory protein